MPFTIICQDITKMSVDAIVNAANTSLYMGGGVCGAIFRAAGAMQMQAACNEVSPIETGEAAITPGFALPCKYVIHTAGPVYTGPSLKAEMLLRSSYTESLKTAVKYGCESIAFPLISSGIYGYPKLEALKVAKSAIMEFLNKQELDVYLVLVDEELLEAAKKL